MFFYGFTIKKAKW